MHLDVGMGARRVRLQEVGSGRQGGAETVQEWVVSRVERRRLGLTWWQWYAPNLNSS